MDLKVVDWTRELSVSMTKSNIFVAGREMGAYLIDLKRKKENLSK